MQMTVAKDMHFKGTGLHSGRPVHMIVHPAPRNHGIVFRRSDLTGEAAVLEARWDRAEQTPLCTRLVNDRGTSLSTIEHLMAAFAGLGITNALVEVNAPEVPILDGSAAPFVRKMLAAGLVRQAGPLHVIRILKPVTVTRGDAMATLTPSHGFHIDFRIDYDDAAIGHQSRSLNMRNGAFVRNLCDSRTFCRQSDVDAMRAAGLALGGTTENAVVFDGDEVLSPGGLRHLDEPVRHKMLDALGDLALAGMPIQGRYTGVRAGHSLTNALLRAVFADPEAFEIIECDAEMAQSLPGVGVQASDLALCA
ncbi:UDP-3-O-acyl-N-acetylglucosamine deacetylase [Fluviibacterium sp. DFM31]|uniref:UDP-3-O-acyl-N-acetylglucosamine deacetylase n=1 Tax=Meridianimarinicoccus marinus TaxID=3231483 RepID=A0ABV3LBB4_9RHOB